jgi:hypothetical protein
VTFVHDGWDDSADWDVAFRYFEHGWIPVLEAYRAHLDKSWEERPLAELGIRHAILRASSSQ